MKIKTHLTDAAGQAMLADALRRVADPARRGFLQRTVTLGGLALLSGCSQSDETVIEQGLSAMSRLNDRAQGYLFDPNRLAPTYPDSMITRPFSFNAYYGEDEVRQVDGAAWRLELSGLVARRRPWTLAQLRALRQESQVTRHICVEGWSAIGKWGGVPFAHFLDLVGADRHARYVGFRCADDYFTSIDMATARHPQTIMALTYDGQPLPPRYGFPMKLRMPTKLGYKNPKHIQAIFVTNTYPGGYWENQGYNWFGGS